MREIAKVESHGMWHKVMIGDFMVSQSHEELGEFAREEADGINKALAPLVEKADAYDKMKERAESQVEALGEFIKCHAEGGFVQPDEEVIQKAKAALALHEEAKKGKQ